MKLNWKDNFKDENSDRLFEIFSEKNRINIEPQIFAGNILFERNCDLEQLKKTKFELIDSIEVAFRKKYNTDPGKIRKENILKELVIRTILAITIFVMLYYTIEIRYTFSFLTLDNKIIAFILGTVSFFPLFWLRKSNDNAIKKVEKETEKKNNLIQKINSELKF